MRVSSHQNDPSTLSTRLRCSPIRAIRASSVRPVLESNGTSECATEQCVSLQSLEDASLKVLANVVHKVASTVACTTLAKTVDSAFGSADQNTSTSARLVTFNAPRQLAALPAAFTPTSAILLTAPSSTQSLITATSVGVAVDVVRQSTNGTTSHLPASFTSEITIDSTAPVALRQGIVMADSGISHRPVQSADSFAITQTVSCMPSHAVKETSHDAFNQPGLSTDDSASKTIDLSAVRTSRGTTPAAASLDAKYPRTSAVSLQVSECVVARADHSSIHTPIFSIDPLSIHTDFAGAAQWDGSRDLDRARARATTPVEPQALHCVHSQVGGWARTVPATNILRTLTYIACITKSDTASVDVDSRAILTTGEHADSSACLRGMRTTTSFASFSALSPALATTNDQAIPPAVPDVRAETRSAASHPAA